MPLLMTGILAQDLTIISRSDNITLQQINIHILAYAIFLAIMVHLHEL